MADTFIDVRTRGPIFDGGANAALDSYVRDFQEELAHQGQSIIRDKANRMNKSGRGGTGRAAAHVHARNEGGSWKVVGESEAGETWWPWLEGETKRNFTTRFRGYHTFRMTAGILNKRAKRVGDELIKKYLPLMGGRA